MDQIFLRLLGLKPHWLRDQHVEACRAAGPGWIDFLPVLVDKGIPCDRYVSYKEHALP